MAKDARTSGRDVQREMLWERRSTLRRVPLSPRLKLLLYVLSDRAEPAAECTVKLKDLSTETGISERDLRRVITDAEDLDLLRCLSKYGLLISMASSTVRFKSLNEGQQWQSEDLRKIRRYRWNARKRKSRGW